MRDAIFCGLIILAITVSIGCYIMIRWLFESDDENDDNDITIDPYPYNEEVYR